MNDYIAVLNQIVLLLMLSLFTVNGVSSQSLQLRLEVDKTSAGIENEALRFSDSVADLSIPGSAARTNRQAHGGCITIRAKENIPVIIKAAFQQTDRHSEDVRQEGIQLGYINDGARCSVNSPSATFIPAAIDEGYVSFQLNEMPKTVRQLPESDGEINGYVLVLLTPQKLGQFTDTHKRQPSGQQAGAILTIDIEYL